MKRRVSNLVEGADGDGREKAALGNRTGPTGVASTSPTKSTAPAAASLSAPAKPALGLVDYGSEDEDD